MNFKIARYIPLIKKEKSLLISVLSVIFLLLIVIATSTKLVSSYQTAQQVKQQVNTMNTFLDEWKHKTDFLNKENYRPVKENQVDFVQSDLLANLKANTLELKGFKAIATNEKGSKDRNFEMTFSGSYESTIAYLNNFHTKDALVNIYNLKMQSENGKIKTVIQYKIYVK